MGTRDDSAAGAARPVRAGGPAPVGVGRHLWAWSETIAGRAVLMVGLAGTVSFTDPSLTRAVAGLRGVLDRCARSDPVYVVAPGGQPPVEVRGVLVDIALVSTLLARAPDALAVSGDAPGWYQEDVTADIERAREERSSR